jgi:hypothetical protein
MFTDKFPYFTPKSATNTEILLALQLVTVSLAGHKNMTINPAEGVTVKALCLQSVGREFNTDSEGFFRASYSKNG